MEPAGINCQVPVLLLIRNRPKLTLIVLEAIRQARPRRLLVAADGPELEELCMETRRVVLVGIDWPCEVSIRFSGERLEPVINLCRIEKRA